MKLSWGGWFGPELEEDKFVLVQIESYADSGSQCFSGRN